MLRFKWIEFSCDDGAIGGYLVSYRKFAADPDGYITKAREMGLTHWRRF